MTPSSRKGSAVPDLRAGAGKRCDDHFVPSHQPCPAAESSSVHSPNTPRDPPGQGRLRQHRALPPPRTAVRSCCFPSARAPGLGATPWLQHTCTRHTRALSCPVLPASGGINGLPSGLGPTIHTDTPSQLSLSQPSLLTNCFVLLGFHLSSPLQTGQGSLVTVQWPTCLAQHVRARPCESSWALGQILHFHENSPLAMANAPGAMCNLPKSLSQRR